MFGALMLLLTAVASLVTVAVLVLSSLSSEPVDDQ